MPSCGKHKRFFWPKGISRQSVESIYVKFMGATCLNEELGRLKKKNAWVSSESSRFAYGVPFSYFKLANS